MPPPKDPIKRAEFIRKQRESHIGKLSGDKNPNYKPKVVKACKTCGKIIIDSPKHSETHDFCSRKCRAIDQQISGSGEGNPFYGKTHTQLTKDTIGTANKDRPQSEATRKKRSESNKKVIHTEEWRNNQSKSLEGRKIEWNDKISATRQGVSLEDWEGFITPLHQQIRGSQQYLNWRTAVFERDNYCDWFSGVKGNGNLNAHHIVLFSVLLEKHNIQTLDDAIACKELWDTNNGVTMIDTSHAAYHQIYC